MAAGIDQRLVDNFQAVAIILAMATVYFGIQYQRVLDAIARRPVEGATARAAMIMELWQSLGYRVMPIGAISGFSAYLFLPNTVAIVRDGQFDPWGFDFIRTAWVFVLAMLLFTFAWVVVQSVRILCKVRRLSK